jgi:predicted secreted protein
VRTSEELGETLVPGQAVRAPQRVDLKRRLRKAALRGAILFAIYYANWSYGWITPDDLDFYRRICPTC